MVDMGGRLYGNGMNNQLKTILLLGALSALVIGLGSSLAPGSWPVFLVISLAMNLGAYFFSDKIVLRTSGAQEIAPEQAPELHAIVEELSAKAQIPKPRVYLIPGAQPNAFATGRNPANGAVAVTEGIVELLDRRQLRGVIAHELAHIKNRDILVASLAAAGASIISYAAQMLTFATLFGGNNDEEESGGGGGILALIVAPIAATLIQLGISRSREYLADEAGARMSGDPEALAQALLKIEGAANVMPLPAPAATASLFIINPLGAGASLARLFSTHPATAERVARLMALAEPGSSRALLRENRLAIGES
jgi:heat shock protein HtpX